MRKYLKIIKFVANWRQSGKIGVVNVRGRVRAGTAADAVALHAIAGRDNSTYETGVSPSKGFRTVIVTVTAVVRDSDGQKAFRQSIRFESDCRSPTAPVEPGAQRGRNSAPQMPAPVNTRYRHVGSSHSTPFPSSTVSMCA